MSDFSQPLFLGLVSNQSTFIAGIVVFLIAGALAFRRSRQTKRVELTVIGLVLLVFPYATKQAWLLWSIGLVLLALLIWRWK